MNRRFGIELEIANITQDKAAAALRAVGLEVTTPGYTHRTSASWKIVPDGSVRNGFEVVSPILGGEAGLEAAGAAINALKAAGARANVTCGFHVHFSASDLEVEDLRGIVNPHPPGRGGHPQHPPPGNHFLRVGPGPGRRAGTAPHGGRPLERH